MIKKSISYTDYNSKSVAEDVYFHLSIDTITNNLGLADDLQSLQEMIIGDGNERELTTPEKQQVLDMVKRFIELSYGVRSEDGSRFRPGTRYPELWDDFRDSAGYDAFLWALFQDPKSAMVFMNDVMPKEAIEQARAMQETEERKAPQDRLPKQEKVKEPAVSDSETVEGIVEEVPEDLSKLTDDELRDRLRDRSITDLSIEEMKETLKRGLGVVS